MKTKKRLSLISLAIMLILLCSCSAGGKTAMSYGSASITEKMFGYTLSYYKSQYLYYYLQSSSSSEVQMTDDPTLWERTSSSSDGKTLGEVLLQNVIDNEKTVLYFASLADDLGVTLTKDEQAEVDNTISSMQSNFDDETAFNSYLAGLGIDIELLRKINTQETLAQKAQLTLFSKGGDEAVSSEDVLNYYEDNYASVKHIYVNDVNYTAENGKTVVLPDNVKAEKTAKLDDLMARLDAGESFESLMDESEDDVFENSSDSYTFAKGEMAIAEYEDAAFDMKEGEIRRVSTSSGTVILKKYPLADITDDLLSDIQNALVAGRTTELLDEAEDGFIINDEIISGFVVADMPIFQ